MNEIMIKPLPEALTAVPPPPKNSTRPLFASLLVMVVLMGAATGIGVFQLRHMASTLDVMVRKDAASRNAIDTINRVTRARTLLMAEVVGLDDPFERDEKLLEFDRLASGMGAAQQQQADVSTTPAEKAVLARQRVLIGELIGIFDRIVDLARQGELVAAATLLHERAIPTHGRMLDTLTEWAAIRQDHHDTMVKAMQAQQLQVVTVIFGVALISILAGLFVAVLVYRWNTRLIGRFVENETRLRAALAELTFRQRAMDAHSIVSEADAEGRITQVNDKFCEVSGYQREELIGKNHRIVKSDFHPPEFFEAMWEAISSGRVWHGEVRNRAKSGQHYWVATTIVPMLDENGLPVRYISVRTEITRLRTTLAELSFRQQAMDAHSIISEADVQGRITQVNDKFCEVSGYQREELIGENHRIVKSDFHPPKFFEAMWETISSGRVWHGEVRNRAKRGQHYWVATTIVPMLDENGLPVRYISVRTDITNIMDMEEAVRQANVILRSNVIARTHELEQAKQQLEQELQERVHTLAALQQSHDELKTLHRQLQDTQQYLMQSEKLAAVGQLAAGMAHEINNPIGFVRSNLATLSRYQDTLNTVLARYRQLESGLDEDVQAAVAALRKEADLDFVLEDIHALLEESRGGVERVRKIVQDLRDFSQVDRAGQRQWVDINHCLDTTLNLLGERFPEGVSVQREYGRLPEIECNPAELNQVFMSLLNNALQALDGNGRITVRSGRDGTQVWVEIADSGEGIAEDVLPHIFDPFFTTRPVGQGAGLGLSMAYGVMQQHDGRIDVQSRVGVGSVFRVTLPLGWELAAPLTGKASFSAGEESHV